MVKMFRRKNKPPMQSEHPDPSHVHQCARDALAALQAARAQLNREVKVLEAQRAEVVTERKRLLKGLEELDEGHKELASQRLKQQDQLRREEEALRAKEAQLQRRLGALEQQANDLIRREQALQQQENSLAPQPHKTSEEAVSPPPQVVLPVASPPANAPKPASAAAAQFRKLRRDAKRKAIGA